MSDLREYLGGEPTATFGTALDEIIQVKPNTVQYGVGNYSHEVRDNVAVARSGPLVLMNFSKYHSGLPPWESVVEFVLASEHGAALFMDPKDIDVSITGDLKSVTIIAADVALDTVDGAIVDPDSVAKKRDDHGTRDTDDFKVTEELR